MHKHSKTEYDGEGARGEVQWEKLPTINPLKSLKLSAFWTQWTAFLIGQHSINLSADVRFPGDTNLMKELTSSGNAAYLICVHLKKYSLSVFATARRSSVVLNFPKNNSLFWKRWKIILPFVSKTTQINSCLTWSWEICFCSTWFITRIFRHQEVLCFKIPNNLKRIILKGKAVSEQEIFQEKEKKTTIFFSVIRCTHL